MNKKLNESMFGGELHGMVRPVILIDEFESKIDSDAIIVAFMVKDSDPAHDLENFIDFGSVDVLDTDVSPSTDQDGNYYVFVEILEKDIKRVAKVIFELVDSIKYLTGITEWKYRYKGKTGKLKLDDSHVVEKRLSHRR